MTSTNAAFPLTIAMPKRPAKTQQVLSIVHALQVTLVQANVMVATTLMNVIQGDTRAMAKLFVPTRRVVLVAHARTVTRDQDRMDNAQRMVFKGECV